MIKTYLKQPWDEKKTSIASKQSTKSENATAVPSWIGNVNGRSSIPITTVMHIIGTKGESDRLRGQDHDPEITMIRGTVVRKTNAKRATVATAAVTITAAVKRIGKDTKIRRGTKSANTKTKRRGAIKKAAKNTRNVVIDPTIVTTNAMMHPIHPLRFQIMSVKS